MLFCFTKDFTNGDAVISLPILKFFFEILFFLTFDLDELIKSLLE